MILLLVAAIAVVFGVPWALSQIESLRRRAVSTHRRLAAHAAAPPLPYPGEVGR